MAEKIVLATQDIDIKPLDQSSSDVMGSIPLLPNQDMRIGTNIRRLVVIDENGVPVMLIGYQKDGF